MTAMDQAMTLAQIGSDLVQEGGGADLINAAVDMARGQVPPGMEMGVATQILMDSASGAAVATILTMPPDVAQDAINDLIEGFREITTTRLTKLRKEKGIE